MARSDWVIVSGGFHSHGGMDRLNAALALYLVGQGARAHLVAHEVDEELARTPGVSVSLVPRPFGSYLAGDMSLDRRASAVARGLASAGRHAVLVANGGNCSGAGVNWAHCVHHAWPCADADAPAWFRLKNRIMKSAARRRERAAIAAARLVIANSERTRQDLIAHLGCAPHAVRTIYPASDPGVAVPDPAERSRARARWCRDASRPLVVFIGALSRDANKGLDTLLAAWRQVSGPEWDAELVAAGGGAVEYWRRRAGRAEVAPRFAGHTNAIPDLLAAADLLVSPGRYEAYGLAVHEAVVRGVPAIVSARAGIAERWPANARDLLLTRPDDDGELAMRLRDWRRRMREWRLCFAGAAHEFQRYTSRDMAARIVDAVHARAAGAGLHARVG